MLTDRKGKPFPTFDSFCVCPKPYGLETDPARFRAYLEAEKGKRAMELETVAPGDDKGGRPKKGEETADTVSAVSEGDKRKAERLRAILRAPELIQDLYRQGLVSQTTAAMLGPQQPDEAKAAQVVRARVAVEEVPEPADESKKEQNRYRKQVDDTIRST